MIESARRWTRMRVAALAATAAIALASPAHAQFSAGYKFLEAVKKKDADAVQTALSDPGTTIVNTRDVTSGQTALHIVTARRDATWMAFLLQKGANVDARDTRGVTPLQIATNLGFVEGVELLIRFKADPDQADDTGETPLISAVHRRNLAMARSLLVGGADPDRPDSSGRSARDYAKLDGSDQLLTAMATYARKTGAGGAGAPIYGPKL